MGGPLLMKEQAYSGRAMALPPDTRVMPMSDEAIAEAARLVLAGEPVAVMLKLAACSTVNVVLFALVIAGKFAGVTLTVPEAAEVSECGATWVAVTEQL